MISFKHNFLFIHIPKTAGNTVQGLLAPYSEDQIVCTAGFQDGVERFNVRGTHTPDKHAPMAAYAQFLSSEQLAGLFKFACIRNPFRRALSFYFSPHRWYRQTEAGWTLTPAQWSKPEFIKMLDQIAPMTSYLALNRRLAVDAVIRQEMLATDLPKVFRHLGLSLNESEIPVRNAGAAHDPSACWDSELIDLVRHKFRSDFEIFGYSMDPE